jgi:hypothetical protein
VMPEQRAEARIVFDQQETHAADVSVSRPPSGRWRG